MHSLKKGLKKSRDGLLNQYAMLFTSAAKDRDDFLEKIEELLILSDIGPQTTEEILSRFRETDLHQFRNNDFAYFKKELKKILVEMVSINEATFELSSDSMNIVMIVGVNGTGKTSFTGKLASYFKGREHKILLVPADTYRAGAIHQLAILANQIEVEILNTSNGADPASVVFDGIKSAKAKKKGLIMIDTAGRLHTYNNLMKELEKIKRVILKTAPEALLKTVLVIDATTGQNALEQARYFKESLNISHLALTKLDGTAKGGIALSIQKELNIPLKFITFGEKITDLSEYNSENFIEALLD